jgi:hypothetical protein
VNAPVKITETRAIPLCEVYREQCELHARLHLQGLISLHTAVDHLQSLSERWHLVALHGQDAIQAEMALAFMSADLMEEKYDPLNYFWQILGQWEADYAKRSKPAKAKPKLYEPPESTVQAFWYVVRQNDESYLTCWLAEHPKDASYLKSLLEAKCRQPSN